MKSIISSASPAGSPGRAVRLALGLLLMQLVLSGPAWARTAANAPRPKGRMFDVVELAKNQWKLQISNYGMFGHDPLINASGGEWPRGTGNMYIYGAGIWFGRLKPRTDRVDTNVTVGYNPSSGKAEFTPGAIATAGSGYAGRSHERVYMYPEDWPPNRASFPTSMQDSWRTSIKIPTPSGDTIYNWFSPIPREPTSTGDCWSVFNDADVANMEQPSTARACSIEVYQYTYDWSLPWNRDVVFFVCNVRNMGPDTIRDAYMAMANDGDIGTPGNDYAGLALRKWIHNAAGTDSIWVDNVGMEWSGPEAGWSTYPGVVAFDFLQSPYKKDSLGRIPGIDGIDNNGNGLIDEPAEGEQIGMTAFKTFTLGDADPSGDGNQYEAMQGKNWLENPPAYEPFDSTRGLVSADQRFMQACGPFSMAPGEMVTLTIGIIGAPLDTLPQTAADRDTMFYALAVTDRAAQQAYDNNWVSPVPPPSPSFVLQPGDGKVTVMWDNAPESSVDQFYAFSRSLKSPYYRERDFQGYKIWRSRSGRVGDWTLLTQFDQRDGIVFEDTFTSPSPAESIRSRATDTGLSYAYVDSVNIRYGFPYYYAVTSFDYNTLGEHDPDTSAHKDTTHVSLESGMQPKTVLTRTEAGNFEPAQANVRQTAGNPDLRVTITPDIIAPQAIGQDTYRLCFGPLTQNGSFVPVYNWCILNARGDTVAPGGTFALNLRKYNDTLALSATLFDSVVNQVRYDTAAKETLRTSGWFPCLEFRIKVKVDSVTQRIFESVRVVSGSYPAGSFGMNPVWPTDFYKFMWAYRGNPYQIVWKTNANGRLTAEVTDLVLGLPVPYRRAPVSPSAPDSADGWCLYDTTSRVWQRRPTDTLTLGHTVSMAINGGLFDLQKNPAARDTGYPISQLPNPGDTWIVNPLPMAPAPILATYNIETQPMKFAPVSARMNVKAVPNPYLVRNEWERHRDFRKLKFINLPSSCVIRIYTMSGDWVRTIRHEATDVSAGSLPNQQGGDEDWDLLTASGQKPAPGIYIFYVESAAGTQTGKFAIVY